ncbi:DUF6884 domain-containing protein [Burkholderia sp. PU8-34]
MSALVLMACSAAKGAHAAPAFDLYRGVMYQTFRANAGDTPPAVVILSAEHGFIDPRLLLSPYDRRMDRARSNEMIDDLARFDRVAWPAADEILLAGGQLYRHVMLAAIARRGACGSIPLDVHISETAGGIGYQRSQLGAWLRRNAPGN